MTSAEVLIALARLNVAAMAAILLVLAARGSVRKYLGAHLTYRLWIIPPLAAGAALLPVSKVERLSGLAEVSVAVEAWGQAQLGDQRSLQLIAVWTMGLLVSVLVMALGQWRFARQAAIGEAGPAVMGLSSPRLVLPRSFSTDYTAAEQDLIRTHERAHIERGDIRVNALAGLVQCLLWFNPLVHVAVRSLREDQELACDATVMESRFHERRTYAEAVLKTLQNQPHLPIGCHWLPHPLETRIAQLSRRQTMGEGEVYGSIAIGVAAMVLAVLIWGTNAPKVVDLDAVHPQWFVIAPEPAAILMDIRH